MSYQSSIKHYLKNLQQIYRDAVADNQHTAELSFRPPLDTLFKESAVQLNGNPNIVVIQEPRNQARMGRPDWRIHDRNTLGVYGYIEAKGLSSDAFCIIPHEDQFNRYLSLGHRLIITDGIDFVYSFDKNTKPQIISLIDKTQMNSPDWSHLEMNPQFEIMMRGFFSDPSPQYCDEGQLVEYVALRTRILSDEILRYSSIPADEAMDDMEKKAILLLDELRKLVYNHNDPTLREDKVFADFASQVIMFTLLYAHRVECTDRDCPVEKERKIKEYLSHEIVDGQVLRPFLTIIHYINNHDTENSFILSWADECIHFLSYVHMSEQQRQHPDYHKLFELFLSKFDPQSRFDYGAYYTPSTLADFIVRLVDIIAIENFDGVSIFADDNTLIDPCCGTGSFLERIRRNDTKRGAYILCGIEILPAPYMLANYRMAILNYEIKGGRSRNELLLANTLSNCTLGDPANIDTIEGFELSRAYEISSRPITLVIGNLPSSDSAKTNSGKDFSRLLTLMEDFRPPVKDRHTRQNIQKQINNPHLQFLRWGCEKLKQSDNHSVLTYIVPATILEADSYRYARKYIIENFSSVWIVSVDADARAGIRTDSIFKTQQGRAILIATRRFGETPGIKKYMYFDISRFSKSKKLEWLEQNVKKSLDMFISNDIDISNYALCPSLPFDRTLYSYYWPVSGEAGSSFIFNNHCSGVKLSPSCIFIHPKKSMLKRRSKEIMQRGFQAVKEWLGEQDKPPEDVHTNLFANELSNYGNTKIVDDLLDEKIIDYAFRPFLFLKAFMWQDLLKKFSRIGGGGTRRRPEIVKAYSDTGTVGFALAHSPKDLTDKLRQFVSFCWYYPDNDLCRRGNSFIYLNEHPVKKRGEFVMVNNINEKLRYKLTTLLKADDETVAHDMIFYTFAVLCSQVYLDRFEGALFITNRDDMRPRIPIVNDAEIFKKLVTLGRRIAELEKKDYIPSNYMNYDYELYKSKVPPNFKLEWSKDIQPFDEEKETITLTDEKTKPIIIPCPLDVQRIIISGYEVIKNVWLKFHSYKFTHCNFTQEDIEDFLNLINKLVEYVNLVGEIDIVMQNIIEDPCLLIRPVD